MNADQYKSHSTNPYTTIPCCGDKDDETFCTEEPCECIDPNQINSNDCPIGQWQCNNGDECIPKDWICNGWVDCNDGSDEIDCQNNDTLIVKEAP